MKGGCDDERYDGRRHDVGHGPRGSDRNRRGRSGDRGADQIFVLPLNPDARGGLSSVQIGVILSVVMKRWLGRQLVRLLLAVFVTTGMGLSVVHASAMAAQMAAVPAMAMQG